MKANSEFRKIDKPGYGKLIAKLLSYMGSVDSLIMHLQKIPLQNL